MKSYNQFKNSLTAGILFLLITLVSFSSFAQSQPNMPADASGPQVPDGVAQFAVDPFWPKPLPNNWIIGQVAGTSVDADDNVWIIHRPWTVQGTNAGSTPTQTTRDITWGHDPLQSLCCTTAPPVIGCACGCVAARAIATASAPSCE